MSDIRETPLLVALHRFAELYARPLSMDALVSGLPLDVTGEQAPDSPTEAQLVKRAAERIGYTAGLIERPLDSISNLVLPCILVLKNRSACILESIDQESGKAKIIHPDIAEGEITIELDKLRDDYLGYAYLLKRTYQQPSRALQFISRKGKHWFWGAIEKVKPIYRSVLIASVLINLFVLATPLYTMNVYDRVVPNDATETLWVLAFGAFLVFIIDLVLRFARSYMLEVANKKTDVIISSTLFEHCMGLRMEVWPKSVGAFSSKLREFESIRNFLASATLVSLVDIPFALLFMAIIAYIAGVVVLVPLVVIGLILAMSLVLVDPLRKSVESTFEANANKQALLVENLHSIQTIKTTGMSGHSQWEWEEATGEIARKSLKTNMLTGSVGTITSFLVNLGTIGILIVGVYSIKNLDITLGALIASVILGSRAIAPMAQLAALIVNYEQTKTAYKNLDELMQLPTERSTDKEFVRRPEFNGDISVNRLSFAYPEAPAEALQNISLKIGVGEHVGIIGKLGSGKTTLANMLAGLYAPTAGAVNLDNIDLQKIDPADVRRNVAYLSQEAGLFRGSLRENILFRSPHLDDEHMMKAAHLGGVDMFVDRYAMGYDTQVGEQGRGLSGGQRQCVALARTLLLDTPIVILDEPTASMDSSTETAVRARLANYLKDRTLVLITHKTSMLDLVDRLIVVDEGRVVMDGPKQNVLDALQGKPAANTAE